MKKPAKVYRVLLFCLVIFAGLGDTLVGTHNGSLFYFTAECFLCVLRYCNGSSSFRFMLQQVYPYITIYLWLHFVHGYSYDQKYCTCIHNIRLCFFFYSLSRFVCAVGSIVAAIIASVDAVGYQLTLKHNLLMYERVLWMSTTFIPTYQYSRKIYLLFESSSSIFLIEPISFVFIMDMDSICHWTSKS